MITRVTLVTFGLIIPASLGEAYIHRGLCVLEWEPVSHCVEHAGRQATDREAQAAGFRKACEFVYASPVYEWRVLDSKHDSCENGSER